MLIEKKYNGERERERERDKKDDICYKYESSHYGKKSYCNYKSKESITTGTTKNS